MQRVDILILSYRAYGRDFEAFMLLKYHLEHSFHLVVRLEPVRDLYWIDRLRPTVLVVTDTKNPSNIVAARYARQCGILVVTIEGEGIFNPAFGEEMIWGWNTDHEIIEDLRLQWSEHARHYIAKFCPELEPIIEVTGGGRFDRYRIYRFKNQSELLRQYRKSGYKRVIGYAGWGFSRLSDPAKRSYQVFFEYFGQEQLSRLLYDREAIVHWLNKMIQAYPDVLFILKQHPGDDGSFSEIVFDYPCENVLRLQNEEKIEDIINACDLWIDYTSTTSLEAWLLDRPTCSLIPSDTSFLRMGYERGSVQIHNDDELLQVIGDFMHTGYLEGFDSLAPTREQIVETYIGWGDGFNSLRAAKSIARLMEKGERHWKYGPLGMRVWNIGRHLRRLLWTCGGQKEYRDDGFVLRAVEHAEAQYYEQIDQFIATHTSIYEQSWVNNSVDD